MRIEAGVQIQHPHLIQISLNHHSKQLAPLQKTLTRHHLHDECQEATYRPVPMNLTVITSESIWFITEP